MNTKELIDSLKKTVTLLEPFLNKVNIVEIGSVDAKWLDKDKEDSILRSKYGIYLFSDSTGNILYIGKAEKDSICKRVWSHLKKPSTERNNSDDRVGIDIYINHRWKKDAAVDNTVKNKIEKGDFLITGIGIEPKEYSSLLEVLGIMLYWKVVGEKPVLNKTF